MRSPIYLLIVFALATSPGRAQVATDTGQRVRVHYGARQRAIGILESVSGESLTIRDTAADRDIVVPRSGVTLVERSLGKRTNFGPNFGITVVVSTLTLGFLSAVSYKPCEGSWAECFMAPESEGQAFAFGVALGAVIGLPLGAIIGATVKSERWAPLTLQSATGTTLRLSPVLGPRIGLIGTLRVGRSSP